MVYKWKSGSRFNGVDVEMVNGELQGIGDNITPSEIVRLARDKKRELHKCFEWDDGLAAEQWRIQTARMVINSIVFIPEDIPEGEEGQSVFYPRVYESVTVESDAGRAYVPISIILCDDEMRGELFDEIKSTIDELIGKLTSYEEMVKDFSGKRKAGKIKQRLKAARSESVA